jgi:hypothetical protein
MLPLLFESQVVYILDQLRALEQECIAGCTSRAWSTCHQPMLRYNNTNTLIKRDLDLKAAHTG